MIIGLSGKIGCGKTELSKNIMSIMDSERIALGDVLKKEVADIFGVSVDLFYSQKGKEKIVMAIFPEGDFYSQIKGGTVPKAMTARELLQWWGTDIRRHQDPAYWIKKMDSVLIQKRHSNVIIDDIRFPEEANLVRQHGGFLVRLEPYEGWEPGPFAGHKSETALDNYKGFDMVIAPRYGELPKFAAEVVERALEYDKPMYAPLKTKRAAEGV